MIAICCSTRNGENCACFRISTLRAPLSRTDFDAATKSVLDKGARNVEILKQAQFSPFRVEQQIAIIYCGTKGLLRNVPLNKVKEFEAEYIAFLENKHKNVMNDLKAGKFTDEITNVLEAVAKDLSANYK